MSPVGVEEVARLPIQFYLLVCALVQVGIYPAAETYRECGNHPIPQSQPESHSTAPVRKNIASAEKLAVYCIH